jgi:hypothetical protein
LLFLCSGFEDDFNSVSDFKVTTSGMTTRSTTFSNDPFDCIDDFATAATPTTTFQHGNIRNVKPLIQPKPNSIGSASFYDCTSSIVPSPAAATATFDDSLSNGKNLIKPSTFSMPTIIKPMSSKVKSLVVDVKKTAPIHQESDESFEDDLPSPPMPNIPPPPPPVLDDDEETCSHAIALFDYESDVVEDLNLKVSKTKIVCD